MTTANQAPQTVADTVIESAASYIISNPGSLYLSFQVNATVNGTAKVMASATDINITTDTFTSTAHGYYTGLKGRFTTSSALPTGLALATDYYIIVTGVNTFQVAASMANALAAVPVAVDITAIGTGNQTFTPVAISGVSYKLQKANDFVDNPGQTANKGGTAINAGNWIDCVSGESAAASVSANITVTASSMVDTWSVTAASYRVLFAIAAGSVKIKVIGHSA
jgi:hypothetical protein